MSIWEMIVLYYNKIGTKGTTITVLIILCTLVQISKIELNPWSYIAKKIRKLVGTEDLRQDLVSFKKEYESKIAEIEKGMSNSAFLTYRKRILDFSRILRDGKELTEVEWQAVFEYIDKYYALHKKYGFKNGFLDAEVEYIKKMKNKSC